MDNQQIADLFDEMADLLELSGENAFRIRAYRVGSKAIRELPEQVADLLADPNRKLTDVEGIGETLAEKSQTFVATGTHPSLEKLRAKVPATLRKVMQVPGVGAKKAIALWRDLQVIDLASLKKACESQSVRELKGFGEKTELAILKSIGIVEQASQRLRIDQADALASRLKTHLQSLACIENLEFAGSFRRGKETVGDLDILVISEHPDEVMDRLQQFAERQETIQRGETKMSIRVGEAFQVDLRVVAREAWGAALQYFTGSKEHNVRVRGLAKQHGLRLNEYGLFDAENPERRVAGATEEEVYQALGMPWIPPELREGRIEFEAELPSLQNHLIQQADLRGDLHMHTTDSDGENSLAEMVQAARQMGLEYIAITDHSKRVSIANGLDAQRLLHQWKQIDAFNAQLDFPFRVFKGVECDILESGELDLSDEVLAQADWVMASIHFGQKQSREQITDRILGAIRHPSVSAISHPTGRLIGRRDPYEVDLAAVIQAAAEYEKCLELNANAHRLDLNDIHCMMAKRSGVKIVISTDAHEAASVGQSHYGILQARRAGLAKQDVVNTLGLKEFQAWLESRILQANRING